MTEPRRTPRQDRSRARVESLLDAAERVFAARGYAEATTNHIAAEAGGSIGALYRFFPDKQSILLAIADRYDARMRALAEALTGEDPAGMSLRAMVGRGARAFNAFLVAHPGFRVLMDELPRNEALRERAARQQGDMAQIVGAMQAALAPDRPAAEQVAVTQVTVSVLSHLQGLSLMGDEDHRARILDELITLVTVYLAHRLGLDPDAPLPRPSEPHAARRH
jgi:AcrR family transcriptional regulator